MGAEYELKYRAEASDHAAIMAAYPGLREIITMQTTYYDTPGGSLSARRYMLRTRLENGVRVCTLKTPGKGLQRGEWEVKSDSIAAAIPELCKLGAPEDLAVLCAGGLLPICGARFTRTAQLLELPDFTAELALDAGFLFAGEKRQPLCEVEIELKSGSKASLDAFAADFAARFGLRPEEKSKFARALALKNED